MGAVGGHLTRDGKGDGVIDGIHQLVNSLLRLVQLHEHGMDGDLLIENVDAILDILDKLGIEILAHGHILHGLLLDVVFSHQLGQLGILFVSLTARLHFDEAGVFLQGAI